MAVADFVSQHAWARHVEFPRILARRERGAIGSLDGGRADPPSIAGFAARS
jgi:hypothetical protein